MKGAGTVTIPLIPDDAPGLIGYLLRDHVGTVHGVYKVKSWPRAVGRAYDLARRNPALNFTVEPEYSHLMTAP